MTNKELIARTDEIIADLVFNKVALLKAYNYYNGKRDKEQFRYLEENFGIGSPTSVEFTPLLKKHIDALVGEYLGTPILPKISCKDSETISNISRDKQLEIMGLITKFLKDHLSNALLRFIGEGKDLTDNTIKAQLNKIVEDINQSFVSQYEVAALNVLQYIMQSRETDLITKLRQLFTDLLITGYCFFRVRQSLSGTNIYIEVLNPLNTFIDRNPESPYVRDSQRAVIRYWYTKQQILAKYGKEMTADDRQKLKDNWRDDNISTYKRSFDSVILETEDVDSYETLAGYPDAYSDSTRTHTLIPVYEVEWIETDKNFVMLRYNTIRIEQDIYILRGMDENVVRSKDNYNYCGLTVNGVYFLNRSQEPYSLILKCAHLQDRYDLLNYYRDVLVANSGVKGAIMDASLLPTNLGVQWPERVKKWFAYRKAGITWIDTAQEGRADNGQAPINTIFNGYDDTLPAQAIQAIDLTIQSVEATVSSITGVFRERLNGIELRDAVSNIKQGVNNSFIVTKHYFQLMDLVACEILLDCLNQAKTTWKNGLTGTIILGERLQAVFTALPEHFTLTDFDIHIISSTEVMLDLQTLKQLIPEFIKSLSLDPEIIFEAMTSKSLTDLKYKVLKAMLKRRAENDLIQQLTQKLDETTKQAQTLQTQLQLALLKIQQLDEQRLKLEQSKIQLEYQVDWYDAQTKRTQGDRKLDIEDKKVEVELALLHDGNPYNDKIRMD